MSSTLPDSLARLINALKYLPGIGEKTAERLAFHIIHSEANYVERLIQTLKEVKSRVRLCSSCYDLTEEPVCRVCRDEKRDKQKLCVVEKPTDLRSIEATGQFKGIYHVLHGTISPLDGAGPESIKIAELANRLNDERNAFTEVILATNHNVEGDATAHYVRDFLRRNVSKPVKVTRLASGIPIGGALAYADHATLSSALSGRGEI